MEGKWLQSLETSLGKIHVYQSHEADQRNVTDLSKIALNLLLQGISRQDAQSATAAKAKRL
ncbi:hypothetical protein LLE49_03985 [Alicyclobacillus tolerans]|uniref:hypothetical protein n=1 Tax=Alicyclobacillus tolerans TaxID=90970 RepID=UPI001F26E638|nr:hypothetical protein [Alicyclobacillus tolerans]MCF8563899.1 hypothetical protein [Alicyclobacillus tolerans]